MKRPAGINAISMLAMLEAVWTGLSLLFHGNLLSFSSLGSGHPGLILYVGSAITILLAAAGLGVPKAMPWARICLLILSALFLLDAVAMMWIGAAHYTRFGAVFFYIDQSILILMNGWIFWFLSRPVIRLAFRGSVRDWSSLL